jgi:acyl-coenzyme A synthetase/AMP-(fatty) acid ligase
MLNDTVELYSPQQFRLVDRKANMINVAGKRSSLSFLNATLTGLPGVVDGVFCVPERGRRGGTSGGVCGGPCAGPRRHSGRIAPASGFGVPAAPRRVCRCLPRDGNGKILARTVQALIASIWPGATDMHAIER